MNRITTPSSRRAASPRLGNSKTVRMLLVALMMIAAPMLSGCALIAVLAYRGEQMQPKKVEAQYRGLDDQTIAVMLQTTADVYGANPGGPQGLRQAVADSIASKIPGAVVLNAEATETFMREHRGWEAYGPAQLLDELGVSRVVLLDLFELQTHPPGNPYVRQGKIAANVNVISNDELNPDAYAFGATVATRWPDGEMGTQNEESVVRQNTLALFLRDASGLFHDHTVMPD